MKKLAILVLLISVNLWAKGNFTVGVHGDIMRFTSYDKFVGGGGASIMYNLSNRFSLVLSAGQYQWGTGVERLAPGYDTENKMKRISMGISFRTYLFQTPRNFPYLQVSIGQDRKTTDWTMNYYSLEDFSLVSTSTKEMTESGLDMGLGIGNEFKFFNNLNFDLGLGLFSPQYTNDHFLLSFGLNYQF